MTWSHMNDDENIINGAAAMMMTHPVINNKWKLYCAATFVVILLSTVLCFDFLEQRVQQSLSLHQVPC